MSTYSDRLKVQVGMDVVASDGEKVGEVSEVYADHFVVQKGFFFPKSYYIPTDAVSSQDEGTVYLTVSKDEAMNQDPSWEQPPVATATDTTATTRTGYVDDRARAGLDQDPEPFEHEQDNQRTHVNEDDDLRIDVSEEELVARRREVDRGAVRIEKDVVAEEQSIDVPVTEERVEVTRRSVDRDATGADAFEEGVIEVPVRGEEVEVDKRARVVEEIDVDKTAETHTERVRDTVRREEVTVDGERLDDTDRNRRR